MSTNGPVSVQGCAYRISRLASDGSIVSSSTAMIQDDRPLVKLEAKPNIEEGVEITPKSACGVPVISYKDCNRYKRWDITLQLGDWDPEQMELVGQGQVLTATGSAGRTFDDGVLAIFENILTSAADADFVPDDVGRPVTDAGFTVATCTLNATTTITTTASFATAGVVAGMTVTGTGVPAGTTVVSVNSATNITVSQATGTEASETLTFFFIPANTYVTEYVSGTEVRMSAGALGTTDPTVDITLGAQPVSTIGYQFPHLLEIPCPFGVSIEVWSKLIVRGTGYPGTTPYPSAGTAEIPGSAYLRTGIFRAFLWHDAWSIENKEQTPQFVGWAIENPNFGTGPLDDWRESALPGVGPAVDTTAFCDQLCDFELPSPLQPGYQTLPVA